MGDLIERLKGLQEWKAAAHKNHTARCGFTACMTKKRATDEGEEWGYVNLGDVMGVAEEAADELARLRLEVKGLRWNAGRDTARILELEGRERDMKAETTIVFAQRDELRRRIAEAERFDAAMLLALGIPVSQDDAFATFALVRLDAEEGK